MFGIHYMNNVSCIVGAGYSHVAGLPLTKDLFDSQVDLYSKSARQRAEAVWKNYNLWLSQHPNKNPEQYLADLQTNLLLTPDYIPFSWAVELIAMVLGTPQGHDPARKYSSPRYSSRITSPTYCSAHTDYWTVVSTFFSNISIITTNYDLLIERSLRHRHFRKSFGIGFHYGGLPHPQLLRGTPSRAFRLEEYVPLKGETPIFKLHGSLNWSKIEDEIILYQDMRPAFRLQQSAAIVPQCLRNKHHTG